MAAVLQGARGALALALGLLALAGCAPASENPPAPSDQLPADGGAVSLAEALRTGEGEDEAAIRLVKESPAPEGEGTTADWIERTLGQAKGQILFERWQARRRGTHQYEVRFTYTVLGDDQSIERQGLRWDVDLVLEVTGPPRFLTAAELASPGRARSPPSRRPPPEPLEVE